MQKVLINLKVVIRSAVVDTVRDYSKINANNTTIANNLYILEEIKDSASDKSLRSAAQELIEAIEDDFMYALSDTLIRIKEVTISFAKDRLLSFIPVYGVWVVIGLSLSDMLFNVSETGKRSVMVCGAGDAIDLLAIDFRADVSGTKQKNAYGSNTYVMYDPYAEFAIRKFTNLSNMIIFGENQMILLNTENHDWLYEFSDWLFGGDTQSVLNSCGNTINMVNGFRYQYVGKL